MFLLPIGVGLWQMRALRRVGQPWVHGQSVVRQLALDANVNRRIDVLLHASMPGPMTCGVVRPAIVLPADGQPPPRAPLAQRRQAPGPGPQTDPAEMARIAQR